MSICMVAVGKHRIHRYLQRLGRILLRIWLNLSEIRFKLHTVPWKGHEVCHLLPQAERGLCWLGSQLQGHRKCALQMLLRLVLSNENPDLLTCISEVA